MPGHQYANFDILLERVRDQYEVKVLSSPVGESPTRMFEMPISDLELRNLVTVASLIVDSALLRKESRGLQYTLDYPHTDEAQRRPTVLQRL